MIFNTSIHQTMGRVRTLFFWATFVGLLFYTIRMYMDYSLLSRGTTSNYISGSSLMYSLWPDRYHGHNFLTDPPFKFDKRFKNPCWFEDGILRCLPYFLILGFRKCGTSSIYDRIIRHPEGVTWGRKETQFFGYRLVRKEPGSADVNTLVDMFSDVAAQIQQQYMTFEAGQPGRINRNITGDGSVCTIYVNHKWREYPGNEGLLEPKVVSLDYLHHFLPDAKIILTFRDPVERLFSEYYFIFGKLHNTKEPSPTKFHAVATESVNIFSDCLKTGTVRQCVYSQFDKTGDPKIHLQLGVYYIYWLEILRLYRRDQILVIKVEELNDVKTLRNIYSFLQMSELSDAELKKLAHGKIKNTRAAKYVESGSMFNSTKTMLKKFYKPFNEYMARLMNDPYFLFI